MSYYGAPNTPGKLLVALVLGSDVVVVVLHLFYIFSMASRTRYGSVDPDCEMLEMEELLKMT